MDDKAHKATVIAAVIGLIGAIGAAVITNYDKIFPAADKSAPTAASASNMTSALSSSNTASALNSTKTGGDADAPARPRAKRFLGALDGIYISDKKDQLTVDWDKRSFSLLHFNCAIEGNIVEAEDFWKVVVVGTDGICSLIDEDDIGTEVGKITPVKGVISNSGHLGSAVVNFDKAGLSELSGVYQFAAWDVEGLRKKMAEETGK